MTAKPTFQLRDRRGVLFGNPVVYWPLTLIVGNVKHVLALHPLNGGWQVSDPASGVRVLRVQGSYKGVPCSSFGMTPVQAGRHAKQQVLALAEGLGIDRFNARLVEVQRQYA